MMLFVWMYVSLLLSPTGSQGQILLEIEQVKKPIGMMRIGVYADEESYLKKAIHFQNVAVSETGTMTVSLQDIPFGTYAISLFHDQNGNGKLDSNWMKIPKEPYGFSRNAAATFGPPKFEKAAFQHGQTITKLKIKL
ncbi:MAG: DUF2141 domain-containing protein [Saprospiraceae bacterium]|nr:DUF2141 domain-containing protein [Saprospiraceae bacterium]